jgi:hypothetical protein
VVVVDATDALVVDEELAVPADVGDTEALVVGAAVGGCEDDPHAPSTSAAMAALAIPITPTRCPIITPRSSGGV